MGLEASNYFFKSKKYSKKTEIRENLKLLNVSKLKQLSEDSYILFNTEYWIDLMLTDQNGYDISIRVALCNPADGIEGGLKCLFKELFGIFGEGVLIDVDHNKKYTELSTSNWRELWNNLQGRKSNLETTYGELKLPISSSLFYKYISERENLPN